MKKSAWPWWGRFKRERVLTPFLWTLVVLIFVADGLTCVVFTGQGWVWTIEAGLDVWNTPFYTYYGLWYMCQQLTNGEGIQNCQLISHVPHIPDWWIGCQTLGVAVFICGLASFTIINAYICSLTCNRKGSLILALAAVEVAAGALLGAICAMFALLMHGHMRRCCPANNHDITEYRLAYCYGLAVIAGILHVVASVVCCFEWTHIRKVYMRELTLSTLALEKRARAKQAEAYF